MIEFCGPTGYGWEVWQFIKRYYIQCPQALDWDICCFSWICGYDHEREALCFQLEIKWPILVYLRLDWDKLEPELYKKLAREVLPF